jgi:hypothetical protein
MDRTVAAAARKTLGTWITTALPTLAIIALHILWTETTAGQCLSKQTGELIGSDTTNYDRFGWSVSVSGTVALVGAPRHDQPGSPDAGSAYVFRFDGTRWVEEQELTASDAAAYDDFGYSVSVSGDLALVGAELADSGGVVAAGAAYVFRFDGTRWVEEQKLTALDAAADDEFGSSVTIDGDTIVIGSPLDDDAGISSGSAYVLSL